MGLRSRVGSCLRSLLRKPQIESQLDEEVRAYVEIVTDERIAAGMPAEEARRSALADFGGLEQVKQAVRDHRTGIGWIYWATTCAMDFASCAAIRDLR